MTLYNGRVMIEPRVNSSAGMALGFWLRAVTPVEVVTAWPQPPRPAAPLFPGTRRRCAKKIPVSQSAHLGPVNAQRAKKRRHPARRAEYQRGSVGTDGRTDTWRPAKLLLLLEMAVPERPCTRRPRETTPSRNFTRIVAPSKYTCF